MNSSIKDNAKVIINGTEIYGHYNKEVGLFLFLWGMDDYLYFGWSIESRKSDPYDMDKLAKVGNVEESYYTHAWYVSELSSGLYLEDYRGKAHPIVLLEPAKKKTALKVNIVNDMEVNILLIDKETKDVISHVCKVSESGIIRYTNACPADYEGYINLDNMFEERVGKIKVIS